jgi:hypothetical protein
LEPGVAVEVAPPDWVAADPSSFGEDPQAKAAARAGSTIHEVNRGERCDAYKAIGSIVSSAPVCLHKPLENFGLNCQHRILRAEHHQSSAHGPGW